MSVVINMIERKIYNDLIKWKENKNKKSLIIKGARQVGKTFIIDKFCMENYKNYVYINFFENDEYKTIFESGLDVDNIIKRLTIVLPNVNLVPYETVIFLDEIQDCPRAITALKFLTIDKRFDIIASGSLLGINYKDEIPSYPVGYVEHLEMYSLDFEEFCYANGMSKEAIKYLKEYFDELKTVPDSIHNKMMELFKEYIIVGGMPAVVSEFVDSHDYTKVLKAQRDIIEDYKMDIGKYAKENEKAKIRDCFLSIPKHLSKDYKKFRYNLVSSGGKALKYQGSLQWLNDANIINFCYNLSVPELPFEGNSISDIFKVYMSDTGLLMAMFESSSAKEILNGNLGIYKGAIYENVIADILAKKGLNLYYFEHNSTIEVDFLIKYRDKITAVEVKSADNTKSKSLNSMIDNWKVEQGIKLSSKNIGISDKIISLPIYMAMFL